MAINSAVKEDSDEEQQEGYKASCVASVALIAGVSLAVMSIIAVNSDSLQVMDKLVRYDIGFNSKGVVITTMLVYSTMIYVGCLVALAAAVGAIGSVTKHKSFVSCYAISSTLLAVFMLMAAAQAINRRTQLEPIVMEQAERFCNGTEYVKLGAELKCSWSKVRTLDSIHRCRDSFCEDYVVKLQKLGGCDFLPKLCLKFMYDQSPPSSSECLAMVQQLAAENSVMYGKKYGIGSGFGAQSDDSQIDECKKLCDNDIMCESIVFSRRSTETAQVPRCLLTAGTPGMHGSAEWDRFVGTAPGPNGTNGSVVQYVGPAPSCYDRTKPYVLQRFQDYGATLAAATIVLAVVLAVSGVVTCGLMYSINVRRAGKPTNRELFVMICCPCLHRKPRRFGAVSDDDEEELSHSG